MFSDANYNAKQNDTKGKGLKILTLKQMLQRLSIALAQVKQILIQTNYLFTVSIKSNY